MIKVDLTKYEVREFINKVRSKAIDAVISEYHKKEKGYLDKQFADLDFDLLEQKIEDVSNYMQGLINKVEKKGFMQDKSYCNHPFINNKTQVDDIKHVVRSNFISTFKDTKMIELEKEKDKKIRQVRESYAVIFDVINRKRSASKMVEYLKGVGFDTAVLESGTSKLDKHNLFPCRYLKEGRK